MSQPGSLGADAAVRASEAPAPSDAASAADSLRVLAEQARQVRQQLTEIVEEGAAANRYVGPQPFTSRVVGSGGGDDGASSGSGERRGGWRRLEALPHYALEDLSSTSRRVLWDRLQRHEQPPPVGQGNAQQAVQEQQGQQVQQGQQGQLHSRAPARSQRQDGRQPLLSSLSVDQDDMDAGALSLCRHGWRPGLGQLCGCTACLCRCHAACLPISLQAGVPP